MYSKDSYLSDKIQELSDKKQALEKEIDFLRNWYTEELCSRYHDSKSELSEVE